MPRRLVATTGLTLGALILSPSSAFYSPAGNVGLGLANGVAGRHSYCSPSRRCQDVGELAASPLENFMSSLADMMSPQRPGGEETSAALPEKLQEGRGEQQDLNAFRRNLINQASKDNVKKQQDFTGYDMYDLIVDKFDVPYDVQINKTVFAGKPVLCLNVMWKYLGQSSFHLSEQAYLEHLEALAQLLKEWDRVDQFKMMLKQTKKRPNPYFGYAVALPLDLAPDTLAGYFEDSYFD